MIFFVSNSTIKVTTNQWNLNYTTKITLLKSNLFCQLYHITTFKVAFSNPSGLTESLYSCVDVDTVMQTEHLPPFCSTGHVLEVEA